MEINLIHIGLIALFSAAWVSGIVQTIESTRNRIGKVIGVVFLIALTIMTVIFVSESPLIQFSGFDKSLYSSSGILALAVGGCCGYFLSTSHR